MGRADKMHFKVNPQLMPTVKWKPFFKVIFKIQPELYLLQYIATLDIFLGSLF